MRVVAWETTRRCQLSCRHCRGAARDTDYSGELSTVEGRQLIDAIAAFASPLLILTGGEPMSRPDIYDLARHGVDRGLRVVMSPCGPLITPATAARIHAAGIARISISLDGATPESHDAFRGVSGAFEGALNGLRHAREAGVEVQVNTTVTRANMAELPAVLDLSLREGAVAFSPFLLVPTGRGEALRDLELSAEEYEQTLHWVYEQSCSQDIHIRPTCAPHYYRVLRQREQEAGRRVTPESHGMAAMTKGCLGGQGFVFISHRGILQPCGFFDKPAGDLRRAAFDLQRTYENAPLFRELRDVDGYRGACGVCEYRKVCGGCRARALAHTGDYLAEEPLCTHVPAALRTGGGHG